MGDRINLTPKERFDVIKRSGRRCHYCGRHSKECALQVDHLIPVVTGGTNDPENLVAACRDCNLGKSARGDLSFDDFLNAANDAERFDALLKVVLQRFPESTKDSATTLIRSIVPEWAWSVAVLHLSCAQDWADLVKATGELQSYGSGMPASERHRYEHDVIMKCLRILRDYLPKRLANPPQLEGLVIILKALEGDAGKHIWSKSGREVSP